MVIHISDFSYVNFSMVRVIIHVVTEWLRKRLNKACGLKGDISSET